MKELPQDEEQETLALDVHTEEEEEGVLNATSAFNLNKQW